MGFEAIVLWLGRSLALSEGLGAMIVLNSTRRAYFKFWGQIIDLNNLDIGTRLNFCQSMSAVDPHKD